MCDKTLQNVISCWRGGVRAGGEGQSQRDGWRGTGPPQACHCHPTGTYTDKKENKIFLIYKKIQMGAVAKLQRKDFLIYEEMRKCLIIYEKAVRQIWLCNWSHLNFLIYEENLIFFLISVYPNKNMQRSCIIDSLCLALPLSFFYYHCILGKRIFSPCDFLPYLGSNGLLASSLAEYTLLNVFIIGGPG